MISILIGIAAMLVAIYMVYTLPVKVGLGPQGPPRKKPEDILAAVAALKEKQGRKGD